MTDDYDKRPFGGIQISKTNRKNESSINDLLKTTSTPKAKNANNQISLSNSNQAFSREVIDRMESIAFDNSSMPFQNEQATAGNNITFVFVVKSASLLEIITPHRVQNF